MSTGSARPLEDAFRIGQLDLTTGSRAELGLDKLDAYQLVSQAVEAPLANVVDPNYTAVAKLAKRYLPGVDVYDGMHARLRDTGGRTCRSGSRRAGWRGDLLIERSASDTPACRTQIVRPGDHRPRSDPRTCLRSRATSAMRGRTPEAAGRSSAGHALGPNSRAAPTPGRGDGRLATHLRSGVPGLAVGVDGEPR